MQIRQLEWEQMSPMILMTKEIGFRGHYSIRRAFHGDDIGYALQFCLGYQRSSNDGFIGTSASLEECKFAAQEHFREWILESFFE